MLLCCYGLQKEIKTPLTFSPIASSNCSERARRGKVNSSGRTAPFAFLQAGYMCNADTHSGFELSTIYRFDETLEGRVGMS